MITVLSTLLVLFFIVVLSEMLWKTKKIHGEAARKLVHILVNMYAAFWPFYLSWGTIRIICVISGLLILVLRKLPIFNGVYDVDRKTWGEIIGTIAVFTLTFIQPNEWAFAIALLHVGLADGFAAIIGKDFGKKNSYKIFSHKKSLAGTITFLAISFLLVATVITIKPSGLEDVALVTLLWLPITAAALENFSPYGSDNFLVPLLVVAAL